MSDWDPFKPDTGLKDDYDGTITSAEFVQVNGGNYALQLVVTADDEEAPEIRLGCGKGWVSYDGGETVEGPSAKARFHAMTAYAKFIGSAMKSGAGDELQGRSQRDHQGRGPMHAALWQGLRFHFEVLNEPGDMPDPNGGTKWIPNPEGVNRVAPTKYLGTTEESTSSPDSKKTSSAQSSGTANTTSPSDSIHPADLATLTQHANELDFEPWVDHIMTLKDQSGSLFIKNKPVMALLASKDRYEALKG